MVRAMDQVLPDASDRPSDESYPLTFRQPLQRR